MKTYHSRSYHAYFEGFTEVEGVDKYGKMKIIRVYTGNYYIPDLTVKEQRCKRYELFGGYLASVVLFFYAGIQQVPVNLSLPIAALEAIAGFLLFLLLRPLGYALFASQKYTVRVYRYASAKFRRYAFWAAVFCLLSALSMGIYSCADWVMGQKLRAQENLLSMLALFGSGILLWFLYWAEKKTIYHQKPSEEIRPTDGVEIQF